ncbi:sugar transferase [Ectopseudomonas oleovorans]|uniref:sugar transferase n=1 Tax=Ectopseudomonas oleovorans TaxID=301 RepID=UPI00244D6748|nr:sugar transferase [Pseudomonas oleovorans]MDH2201454.1 sugar transferase [Pseudomonas oleovorans]
MTKRLFDVLASFFGLLILTPVFALIAVWIKLDSAGPVFFRQERVGLFGVPFKIHKFRTMRVDAEKSGRLTVGADSRITRSGHFLRKTKIDELPQLIDVFLGRMSLVGPRPEVQEFIDCYPAEVREKVLSVRPGITDKASIEMVDENEILAKYDDFRQAYIDIILPIKQAYYVEYVDSQSLLLDFKLIILTLKKIITR